MANKELSKSTFDWFFKYKVYHIPFWFVYHYLWWTINIGDALGAMHNIFFSAYSLKYCFYVIFQAIGAYINLYFLIPRFLERGRYGTYLAYLAITITVTALIVATGYYFSAWISTSTFEELYKRDPGDYLKIVQLNTLPSTVAAMTLAMSVKLTKKWLESRRREELLQREKMETELKFLKSQFNPHFLFNTINSIFVLISKDPKMAAESLAKFSDILRYQLYECNEHQIPLSQELGYLSNYIELQKLRHDQNNALLTVEIESRPNGNLMIAPFILMPFIENAFKHVSHGRSQLNWITIDVGLNGNILMLKVATSKSALQRTPVGYLKPGGLGLKNVGRRLELVYPQMHSFEITQTQESFQVELSIQLTTETQRHHTREYEQTLFSEANV